jgi:large subunit ribosomal protein L6
VSRVGALPIKLADGVEIKVGKQEVAVKGPKGSLSRDIHPQMKVEVSGGQVTVQRPSDSKQFKSLHGLYRTLINNMVVGVTEGFQKKLEIVGVGYKGEMKNNKLVLQLGYSHPIVLTPPEGITIEVDGGTRLSISGIDKELVGKVAAKIRSFRPPEPYKGKGVKYEDEHIRRKAGKTAA